MKKILIIIGAIILSIPSSGQTIKGWFYARDYYSLDGTEVTGWSGGYLPDTNKVNLLILGALDTTVAAVDTIYISGQDEWVGNNDTIYKVDSAGISDTALFALNATADSSFVSVTGTDTVKGPLIFNETDIEIKSNSGDINLNGGNLGVANLGTDKENGTFYTGSVEPTNVFALNYDGIFRATGFKSDTSYSDTLTAVKIKTDTIEFVGGYIANLYDQSIEIYATDYDASIIVGGEVEGIALETNGTITFTAVSTVIPALSSTGIVTESLSADTITADTITSIKTKTDTISMGNVVLTADEDTIKALNFWARFKGVIASVFRGDTIILGDSVITGTITLKAAVEAEQFDEINFDTATKAYSEGRLHYQASTKSLTFYNDISNFSHQLGYEFVRRVYNGTGSTIPDGSAVRRVGTYKNGELIASVALAGNSTFDSAKVYGITTVSIAPGAEGIVVRGGDVRGLDLSGMNDTTGYLGFAGTIVDTCPTPPYICVELGEIIYADADSGQFDVAIKDSKYSPNPVFSAFFSDSSITITNPGQDTYENITNATNNAFTEKRNIGFTFQGDSISPKQDGNYTIFYSYSFQGSAVQDDLWRIGTFIDGVLEYSTSMTSSSTSNGGVPYPTTVALTAGQWISFRVTNNTDGTRDCIFIDSTVTINKQ